MRFRKSKIHTTNYYYYIIKYRTEYTSTFRSYLPSATCLALNYIKVLSLKLLNHEALTEELKLAVRDNHENNKKQR